jgi:hypothetical protein
VNIGEITPPGVHLPVGYQEPTNATTNAYAKSILVSSSESRLFGFSGYNSGAAQFVLVFDATALPADGAAPDMVIPVAATSLFSAYFGSVGRWMYQGIVLCNSSTGPTLTIGAADCWFDVQYL